MITRYELWDIQTGNYLETLETQAEVDEAIAEYVELEGEWYREWIGVKPIQVKEPGA